MQQNYPRLSEALARYEAMRKARFVPTTVMNDMFVLKRFLIWLGEDIQVRHLSPGRVEAWFYGEGGVRQEHVTRDGKTRAGVLESTHNHYRSRLKMFFAYCSQNGWLRQDLLVQVPHMRVPRTRRMQPKPRILLALLDHAQSARDRCYLATAINTGLRANEIARLRVGDVDLDQGNLIVWISKSKEEDLLPITSDLDGELRRWLTAYAHDLGRPLHLDDFLFPARLGSRYVWRVQEDGTKVKGRTAPSWIPEKRVVKTERIVHESLAAVGLPTLREGTHTIRRAVARAFFDSMVASGYDGALKATSALLHHRSVATTEHYLGLTGERERRDKMLRGKPFLTAMLDDTNVVPLKRTASDPSPEE